LLVAYVLVLLYSYLAGGLILPAIRLLVIYDASAFDRCFSLSWTFGRVQGREVMMNYLMHVIVSLTFGLASPIVGILVTASILSNVLLVGRLWILHIEQSKPTL
jgi:hypothetical protein